MLLFIINFPFTTKAMCMRKIFPIPFICTRYVVVTTFALIRKLVRSCRDNFMFHAFIKPLARVPANDSFAARRIAGPGLASNFLYQIRPEEALAAVFLHVEKAYTARILASLTPSWVSL